jgi:putative membrane protein
MRYGWPTAIMAGGVALCLPAIARAQQGMPYYGYGPGMMWDDGGGWFHMLFGFLMMLLFLGVVVVLVVLGVRWLGTAEHSPFRHPPGAGQRTALDILKERLAKGEIDVAEFEERKRALGD